MLQTEDLVALVAAPVGVPGLPMALGLGKRLLQLGGCSKVAAYQERRQARAGRFSGVGSARTASFTHNMCTLSVTINTCLTDVNLTFFFAMAIKALSVSTLHAACCMLGVA